MQVVTITTFEPTTGNKIVETLYSNRVTSENKSLSEPSLKPYDVIFAPKTVNIKNPKTYGNVGNT